MGSFMFLQSMREKTQSWVAYVIVGLLILSFGLWGISSYFGGGQDKGPIATVGGQEVSYASFISAYRTFLQNTQTDGNHLTSEQENFAKQEVLKSLIERLAVMQYINKIGFAVNQQQIDAALMSVPLFSENGEFSPALFKRFLIANNVSAQQFIADFSTRMVMAQWDEGIRISGFASTSELSNIISLLKQKRQIVYGIVKFSSSDIADIAPSDIQKYYDDHQKNYLTPEQVKISYVKLNFADVVNSLHPTEKELITYYTQNESRYDVPERWQVNVINVSSTASASEVAEQVASAVKKKNGLISLPGVEVSQKAAWLSMDNLAAEVKNALQQIAPNATTIAFKTSPDNYVVYQLIKHQPAVEKQYYEVKHAVQKAYLNEQANKKWTQMLEEMTDLSYEHPDSLNPLAKRFNTQIQTSNFFSQNYDGKPGIESNAEVIAAAFSDDVLSGGNNSDVIKLDHDKTALVLRVADSIAAHEQAITEVSTSIKKTLINQRAMLLARQNAEKIKTALESGEAVEKIQKEFGVILTKISIGRFSQSVPNEILQQAFVLPVDHAGVTQLNDSGFSVVEVLAVTPGKIATVSAKDQAMYQNVIVNEWTQAELLGYMHSIIADTKVKIHEQAKETNS
jgi:peptidyl-prolyl cis-trans isomerase D